MAALTASHFFPKDIDSEFSSKITMNAYSNVLVVLIPTHSVQSYCTMLVLFLLANHSFELISDLWVYLVTDQTVVVEKVPGKGNWIRPDNV